MFDIATFNIQHQQSIVGVGKSNSFAIGRPGWHEIECWFGDLYTALIFSMLIRDHHSILATFVIEPGNLLAIRRPNGMPVSHTRSLSNVSPAAFVQRRCKQVAASLKDRSFASWRESGISQVTC